MINWCARNLSPVDMGFQFYRYDVWNLGLGPTNTRQTHRTVPGLSGPWSAAII
jgi:hypothetical protein